MKKNNKKQNKNKTKTKQINTRTMKTLFYSVDLLPILLLKMDCTMQKEYNLTMQYQMRKMYTLK